MISASMPSIESGVHWTCGLIRQDQEWQAWCAGVLSADETARAAKFLMPHVAACYRGSHGALRAWLSSHLGIAPQALQFVKDRLGKPELAPKHCAFNLSHSDAYWSAAVHPCPDAQVGIDIEALAKFTDAWPDLARHILSADELSALAQETPESYAAILARLWTRKEALLKAIGVGLRRSMCSLTVGWSEAPVVIHAPDADGNAASWTIHDLAPLPDGLAGALAVRDLR
ncbi:4'-phosphopantetheinyl transferase family protein [Paraherbaspirillum soli]|uniref:4'-phosphopantetheinyl transferase family protein n=1 Tax=Paraherbaspirillum soli TaxID=631222 RepID=A0ABW0M986_9BURK